MSDFQYAMVFEATSLSVKDIKKIRNYFQIKRGSGGGECGEVEKVKENTYKINFLEEKALDTVLRKKDHRIKLSGREILITVKPYDNEEEQHLPHSTATKEDMSFQKVFKVDPFLLRFLKDNSNATSYLNKLLSSFLTTFKFDLVTETVRVVIDAVQMDQSDALQKWGEKMDIVFSAIQSRYMVYFETDPKRLERLENLQKMSLPQNVGIYDENGLTVIVGEPKEVNMLLDDVDAINLRQQAHKECPVSDMHYALVKEKFEEEIKSKYSKLEITCEQPGCIVLKGSEEQVNSAATEFEEYLKLIKEKKIPLSHSLQTFLASSSAIQIFQTRFRENLCCPVLIESVGSGSDLVLLSLSAGAIQEASYAMQRDLCVETVILEKYAAELSSIDALNKALNPILQQANQETFKVDLSYETGTDNTMKIQLAGFNTEVIKLKNIIRDHKQNYAQYCDTVSLPSAEIVDHFSELLSLLGVTVTDVKLNAAVSPLPCVKITGPRCKVIDMKSELQSSINHLILTETSVDGPGVLKFFKQDDSDIQRLLQSSYHVLIFFKDNNVQASGHSALTARSHSFASLPNISAHPSYFLTLEIVFGGLEDQQTDVLVAPMLHANLNSTKVGIALFNKAGQQFKNSFNAAKKGCKIIPGNVLEVDGTPFGCKKVFFIECVPWTKNTHNSEKALRCGLEQTLTLCKQQLWSSVAFPVIGPGSALALPVQNAAYILVGEIKSFCLTASTSSLSSIKIVMMPNYPDSEEINLAVSTGLTSIMVNHTGQALFQSLSSEIDEITIPLARCQVHLRYGDISNEITDVIVNTTDFADFETDVCNDILTIAGPQVRAALTGVNINKGQIFITQSGDLNCKSIMHVCGENNPNIIKTLVKDILLKCEHSGYKSVAIPAIGAGKGGVAAELVAKAILQGVKDATVEANFNNLKTIHIVLMKINVFMKFKEVVQSIFGKFTQNAAPLLQTPLRAAPSSLSLDLSSLFLYLPDQHTKAEFVVVGLTNDNVTKACQELNQAYQRHCSSHVVSNEETKHLTADEMDDIIKKLHSLGIQISQQGPNGLTISGLTRGINEFMQLIRGSLVRQVKRKEQDVLFSHVSWCILGLGGTWERLPKEAHHQLENRDIAGGILDAKAQKWTVNLTTMKATAIGSTVVAKLKRQQNLSDFFYPLYWDSMDTKEFLKVIPLDPNLAEYKRVKSGFKRTASKAVLKIDRIQNLTLRQAYEVRKKELQNKNGVVGAGEKILYHGTTAEAAVSIQSSNFNRRFAGQNGTTYGHGTYFAVDSSYSASPAYSPPSDDGTQLMFVCLVLTGHYTKGSGDMKVPPPRSSQNPNDRFDSLVNDMQNPIMFVVFHDCQAYPDYLITFK